MIIGTFFYSSSRPFFSILIFFQLPVNWRTKKMWSGDRQLKCHFEEEKLLQSQVKIIKKKWKNCVNYWWSELPVRWLHLTRRWTSFFYSEEKQVDKARAMASSVCERWKFIWFNIQHVAKFISIWESVMNYAFSEKKEKREEKWKKSPPTQLEMRKNV